MKLFFHSFVNSKNNYCENKLLSHSKTLDIYLDSVNIVQNIINTM